MRVCVCVSDVRSAMSTHQNQLQHAMNFSIHIDWPNWLACVRQTAGARPNIISLQHASGARAPLWRRLGPLKSKRLALKMKLRRPRVWPCRLPTRPVDGRPEWFTLCEIQCVSFFGRLRSPSGENNFCYARPNCRNRSSNSSVGGVATSTY